MPKKKSVPPAVQSPDPDILTVGERLERADEYTDAALKILEQFEKSSSPAGVLAAALHPLVQEASAHVWWTLRAAEGSTIPAPTDDERNAPTRAGGAR